MTNTFGTSSETLALVDRIEALCVGHDMGTAVHRQWTTDTQENT
jgi:hypothetical protein